MERRPFPIRFSQYELQRLRMEAKLVGWSVSQLIRFRALRGDPEVEKQMARQLEALQKVTQEAKR